MTQSEAEAISTLMDEVERLLAQVRGHEATIRHLTTEIEKLRTMASQALMEAT